jgi:hypothetical protein
VGATKSKVAPTRKLDAGKLFELSKLACRAGLDLRGTPERLEIAQPVHQWVPTGAGDTNVYRACQRAEERLREQGARIDRVVLDCELKRDYQRFLQEHNRGRKDSDGRPIENPRR